MSKKPPSERITLHFDILDLPTAQHRAGLAGLVLQVESMKKRRLPADRIPERIPELSGPGNGRRCDVHTRIDAGSLRRLI